MADFAVIFVTISEEAMEMKRLLKRYGKWMAAAAIVIIFTIILFPRCAVWKQFHAPIGEFTWLATKDRDYAYERKLTIEETRKLRSILEEITLYDLRKVACDRIPGEFDGELRIGRTTYGVDLTSGLIRSHREIGWLKAKQISWFKLLCLMPSIPAESNG